MCSHNVAIVFPRPHPKYYNCANLCLQHILHIIYSSVPVVCEWSCNCLSLNRLMWGLFCGEDMTSSITKCICLQSCILCMHACMHGSPTCTHMHCTLHSGILGNSVSIVGSINKYWFHTCMDSAGWHWALCTWTIQIRPLLWALGSLLACLCWAYIHLSSLASQANISPMRLRSINHS